MGRTRSSTKPNLTPPKKAMSSTERSKKRRLDPAKRDRDNTLKRIARKKAKPLSEEELERKREAARLRKAKSRMNQSSQKKMGTKVKDRNRKRKNKENNESLPKSTERVRQHRDKIKFNFFSSKRQKLDSAAKRVRSSLSTLSPNSRVDALTQSCSNILSPGSTSRLASNINNPLKQFTKTISKKRDKLSNCARRLALGSVVKSCSGNLRSARRSDRSLSWKSLQSAVNNDVSITIKHYKTIKSKKNRPPTETTKKILDFYNKDDVSRQLPYKNLTRKIKDHTGVYHRVPVRVMEITLRNAYLSFKRENDDVKISQRAFEQLRPKNIRLRRFAQRLQCCCTYHTNVDYLRKSLNRVFINNGKAIPFPSNEILVSSSLCNPMTTKCIMRCCSKCKNFPMIDDLKIESLKCSKSCYRENKDCSEHTINLKQFERVAYIYKGKEKKKLQLVDKAMKLSEIVNLLKIKMQHFPKHRFNVELTAKTYDNVLNNLTENMLFKIHDFSENYTCLLPEEIQSLHWVQETATVYPVVILRKVGLDIREDHLVFISDDKKHDVPFVERCNEILHQHYADEGLIINHDIEYNDGCGSQFKCIRAFSSLARRNIKTTRIFCETSHGKSKSDGLGGVVKSFASRAVCGERKIMRNAEELFEFLNETLTVNSAFESHKPMLNRKFFYVSSTDMNDYRKNFPSVKYHYIPGTLSIHQVTTTPGDEKSIVYRRGSCGCSNCLASNFKACMHMEDCNDYPEVLKMTQHVFSAKIQKKKVSDDVECDLDEDELNELEEELFIEKEAAKTIQVGDIAVIKTGDDHPYYLIKVTSGLFETEKEVTDAYHHTFPPNHRVIEGHYLEIFKETSDGALYYIDFQRKAMISAFCIVGNCPDLPSENHKRRGKDTVMFTVDHDMHQALSEIAISE